MFEKLLEYQKLDGKLLSIKRELEHDVSRQTLNKVVSLVKESQNKLLELDDKAKVLNVDYEKSKNEYDKVFIELESLSKIDSSKLSEEELNANIEKANKLVSALSNLERTLSFQAENLSSIIKNFEVCRNNIVLYKQKYVESKNKVAGLENALKPKVEEIKKQMLDLEKGIDKDMLAKYRHLRQDRIFPVFVPLNQNSCGGCSMGIPSALMNKLKSTGYLECEQCRRYIYI